MEANEETFFDKLKEKYPVMYGNVYCGMWVDEGWHKIIEVLSYHIDNHVKQHNARIAWRKENGHDVTGMEELPEVEVHQIKEKFGGLRFYTGPCDDYVNGLIMMAEEWADHTCEYCGQRGKSRNDIGWIKTLCDHHYEETKRKQEEQYGRNEK